jgi:uncharacterized protein (DUF362 family)
MSLPIYLLLFSGAIFLRVDAFSQKVTVGGVGAPKELEEMAVSKFHIQRWTDVDKSLLERGLRAVDRWEDISRGTRIFIKPNFTFPFFKKGVTTPPDFIRGVVEILVDKGAVVTIGEGAASLDKFSIHDSFTDHGIYSLQEKYGIRVVHLGETEVVHVTLGRKRVSQKVPLPKILLEDNEVFITLPVAKVHAMTTVSLATKNQWGCIASDKRCLFHSGFNEIICGLNKLLPKHVVICDGRYVLTDNGPMFGTAKEGQFLAMANDIGTFDVAMCRLMGFDHKSIGHIWFMAEQGMAPAALADTDSNEDPAKFRPCEFKLRRTVQNYIALAGFHSSLITWFGYDSFAADFLHKVLYSIKPDPLVVEIKKRDQQSSNLGDGCA